MNAEHIPPIAPELTVAEVCERWPAAVQVFIQHGMACVGCDLSTFETLSSAARVYRIPLPLLLEELERATNKAGPGI